MAQGGASDSMNVSCTTIAHNTSGGHLPFVALQDLMWDSANRSKARATDSAANAAANTVTRQLLWPCGKINQSFRSTTSRSSPVISPYPNVRGLLKRHRNCHLSHTTGELGFFHLQLWRAPCGTEVTGRNRELLATPQTRQPSLLCIACIRRVER